MPAGARSDLYPCAVAAVVGVAAGVAMPKQMLLVTVLIRRCCHITSAVGAEARSVSFCLPRIALSPRSIVRSSTKVSSPCRMVRPSWASSTSPRPHAHCSCAPYPCAVAAVVSVAAGVAMPKQMLLVIALFVPMLLSHHPCCGCRSSFCLVSSPSFCLPRFASSPRSIVRSSTRV